MSPHPIMVAPAPQPCIDPKLIFRCAGSGSDSSDMDVEDCDKRREEYVEDLTELENQFTILREQLYR